MTGDIVGGYADFLQRKTQSGADSGFAPVWMPDFLFAAGRKDLETSAALDFDDVSA